MQVFIKHGGHKMSRICFLVFFLGVCFSACNTSAQNVAQHATVHRQRADSAFNPNSAQQRSRAILASAQRTVLAQNIGLGYEFGAGKKITCGISLAYNVAHPLVYTSDFGNAYHKKGVPLNLMQRFSARFHGRYTIERVGKFEGGIIMQTEFANMPLRSTILVNNIPVLDVHTGQTSAFSGFVVLNSPALLSATTSMGLYAKYNLTKHWAISGAIHANVLIPIAFQNPRRFSNDILIGSFIPPDNRSQLQRSTQVPPTMHVTMHYHL
ncbi:MAG: hypothetical protein RL660_197 [Bacteroidota bacterium]|jgi:hypothetical protein